MKESLVHGVKLEGGKEFAGHIRLLTSSGIPDMAHIGLTPQSEHTLSGYKVQGRDDGEHLKIIEDARALQEAGAFACVIELVPSATGAAVAQQLDIPVVGIGAGSDTDGQVLVWHDMAGFSSPKGSGAVYLALSEGKQNNQKDDPESIPIKHDKKSVLELNKVPKFVKRYANLSQTLFEAAVSFASDVKSKTYPADEHCYK